ncbi:hypothetical protein IEQ34_006433 [Dendrobium chrysotoxum]|uniref:Uncharacterized protein n=1 Tax=Dendrobium chrysotoxum TaxID=161865 RepID=A0AAV7HDV0_DENCH|nr:hypothetical protein IEQ34_006433 [Dendrobium chrysotoxum]
MIFGERLHKEARKVSILAEGARLKGEEEESEPWSLSNCSPSVLADLKGKSFRAAAATSLEARRE